MRVVLDTNILVSGLLWLGPSNKILRLAEEGKIESCFSPDLFEELHQVLKRQKFISRIKALKISIEELIAGISDTLELFPDTKIPGVIKEDPMMTVSSLVLGFLVQNTLSLVTPIY